MNNRVKRRDFFSRVLLAVMAIITLGVIVKLQKEKKAPANTEGGISPEGNRFAEELAKNQLMPRDLVMKMLDQKVNQYMQRSHHCAQSSFMALNEQFGLQGDQVFKALTPLPGIAERGETCGAITGPLMAMGLIYGRDIQKMEDWDIYQGSLIPAGRFCDQFENEFGTTLCHEVQKVKFGRCYQLTDPDELQDFQNAGATEHCSAVVRSAVRMAAEIILEDETL